MDNRLGNDAPEGSTPKAASIPRQRYEVIEASEYDESKGDVLFIGGFDGLTSDVCIRPVPTPAGLDEIIKRETQKCAELFPASFGLRAKDFEPHVRRACEDAMRLVAKCYEDQIDKLLREIESLNRQVERSQHYIKHLEACVENIPKGMGDLTRELLESRRQLDEANSKLKQALRSEQKRFDELQQSERDKDRLRNLVIGLRFWTQGSLQCKSHAWEPDQRAAAQEVVDEAIKEEQQCTTTKK